MKPSIAAALPDAPPTAPALDAARISGLALSDSILDMVADFLAEIAHEDRDGSDQLEQGRPAA